MRYEWKIYDDPLIVVGLRASVCGVSVASLAPEFLGVWGAWFLLEISQVAYGGAYVLYDSRSLVVVQSRCTTIPMAVRLCGFNLGDPPTLAQRRSCPVGVDRSDQGCYSGCVVVKLYDFVNLYRVAVCVAKFILWVIF